MRSVTLNLTEQAVSLMRSAHAERGRRTIGLPRRRRRLAPAGPLPIHDLEQIRSQSTYFRLVSTAEAYLDTLSQGLFDRGTTGAGDLVEKLVLSAQVGATGSWRQREEAFSRFHGIRLSKRASFKQLKTAIDVRNSIAHGLGSLTPRQRNLHVRSDMQGAGISFRGDLLIIDDAALRYCLDACVCYVLDVDRSIPDRTGLQF